MQFIIFSRFLSHGRRIPKLAVSGDMVSLGRNLKLRPNPGSFELCCLTFYSPMVALIEGKTNTKKIVMQWELGKRHDLWNHRYEHSFLQLRRLKLCRLYREFRASLQIAARLELLHPVPLRLMASNVTNLQKQFNGRALTTRRSTLRSGSNFVW